MSIQSITSTNVISALSDNNIQFSNNSENNIQNIEPENFNIETIEPEEMSLWDKGVDKVGNFFEATFDNIKETGAWVTGEIVGGWQYVLGDKTSAEVDELIYETVEEIKAENAQTSEVKNAITSFGNSIERVSGEYVNATKDLFKGKISLNEYMNRCNATTVNATIGIVEGVGRWGEKAWDTIKFSSNYTIGKIFQLTGQIDESGFYSSMDEIKDQIADNNTKYIYDALYEDTSVGQTIYNESFAADDVRNVGNMAGEVGMNIGLMEAGGSPLAVVSAGVTGYGEGLETAYANGASVDEGMYVGALNATYNSVQWAVGIKINKYNPFQSELNNAALHIVLDSATGATDGLFQPLTQLIYVDGYYDNNGNYIKFNENETWGEKYQKIFEENGGWNTVGKYAKMSGLFSGVSEIGGLSKYFRNKDVKANAGDISNKSITNSLNDAEIAQKTARYNELSKIASSDDYIKYMDNAEKGYAQVLRSDYDEISKELANLEKELGISDNKPIDQVSQKSVDNGVNNNQESISPINHEIDKINNDLDLNSMTDEELIKKYNELSSIKNSDEYIQYLKNAEDGYAQTLKKEFYQIENTIEKLENKIVDIYKNNDLVALMTKAGSNDYGVKFTPEQLRNKLHSIFDRKYGSDYVNYVSDQIKIVPESEWDYTVRSHTDHVSVESMEGFVDKNTGIVYVKDTAGLGIHSPIHESMHKFSEWKQELSYKIDGTTARKTGIREFYMDGESSHWANELLTDYLTSKVDDGKYYNSIYESNEHLNKSWWERIDNTMEYTYGSDTVLLDAYLDNDIQFLRQYFDNLGGGTGTYDFFVRNMKNYYDDATKNMMEKIVSTIESNIYPKQESGISSFIKKIFGG